jgi:hypothetical protein
MGEKLVDLRKLEMPTVVPVDKLKARDHLGDQVIAMVII